MVTHYQAESPFCQVLIGDTPCPQNLQAADIGEEGTRIVDGQAHVIALGKPLGILLTFSLHQYSRLRLRSGALTSFSKDSMIYPSRVAQERNGEKRQCL